MSMFLSMVMKDTVVAV